ncbi:hypothetical protein CDD83_4999 [Cordyceps sp. RAO-2017]|nr:hypothetical protein CDD83_4999 [Cordyceps sp. RAO-2017]
MQWIDETSNHPPPDSPLSEAQYRQFLEWLGRKEGCWPNYAEVKSHVNSAFSTTAPSWQIKMLLDSAISKVVPQPDPTPEHPLKLPGYGLPLGYLPPSSSRFPILMGISKRDWAARTLLVREVCMLRFMEDITNKPEWWMKVRDPRISGKWMREAQRMDWGQYRRHGDFTKKMAVACMQELRRKADLYEETGLIPVLDYSACVVKSDRLMPQDLIDRLKDAVRSLEDVPEDRRDWHPGSDGKVLDLVHPSLWPLLYGKSRIMRNQRIGLKECLDFCGRGFLMPRTDGKDDASVWDWLGKELLPSVSTKFQWLPCDVVIDEEGHAKIDSYINNLHPVDHADLYPIIESFIEKALPAWDMIYRWVRNFPVQRMRAKSVGRRVPIPDAAPDEEDQVSGEDEEASKDEGDADMELSQPQEDCATEEEKNQYYRPEEDEEDEDKEEEASDEDDASDDDYGSEDAAEDEDDNNWFGRNEETDNEASEDETISRKHNRRFKLPAKKIKRSGFFNHAPRVQVIVKLANIQLTPEKPSYEGGSWHVEGQLNEHICATALFYYDSDNISESRLAFRAAANAEKLGTGLDYEQGANLAVETAFAIRSRFDTMQDVGSVLTRSGRAVFFPNLFQHRVQPFALADPSRPGHRKILALFLVDPAVPVISTANVPPQQRHWCAPVAGSALPPDVAGLVLDNMDSLVGEEEARRLRRELMDERTVMRENTESRLKEVHWSFCEH